MTKSNDHEMPNSLDFACFPHGWGIDYNERKLQKHRASGNSKCRKRKTLNCNILCSTWRWCCGSCIKLDQWRNTTAIQKHWSEGLLQGSIFPKTWWKVLRGSHENIASLLKLYETKIKFETFYFGLSSCSACQLYQWCVSKEFV